MISSSSCAAARLPCATSRCRIWINWPANSSQFTMNCRSPFGWKTTCMALSASPASISYEIAKRLQQARRALVAHANVPAAVDDNPRIRLLLPQHEIQRLPHRLQIIGGQSLVAIGRHEACRDMQGVSFFERQIERAAEQLHHLAARLRAAGFQKAQMPGGDIGIHRQVDLGKAAHLSPVLQQAAEMPGRGNLRVLVWRVHARQSRPWRRKSNYLGCK